ncbi:MAG: hypothetical protein H0U27_12465 [Nitrosopumilus sp.]|nr:hypothetical protein [Nitrosopumilus sp.]
MHKIQEENESNTKTAIDILHVQDVSSNESETSKIHNSTCKVVYYREHMDTNIVLVQTASD